MVIMTMKDNDNREILKGYCLPPAADFIKPGSNKKKVQVSRKTGKGRTFCPSAQEKVPYTS